jgi:hypothetical protein
MALHGGTIPPQGRPPTNKGVGSNARRHDLERPKTPGLHNSSLQYGDVSRLEQAQRTAPLGKQQNPVARPQAGASTTPPGGSLPGQGGFAVPNPIEFAKRRLGGSLQGKPADLTQRDTRAWIPLFRRIANQPRGSGTLRNAMIEHLSTMINAPSVPTTHVIDMDQMDRDLELFADGF